jgi:hypothetical protein
VFFFVRYYYLSSNDTIIVTAAGILTWKGGDSLFVIALRKEKNLSRIDENHMKPLYVTLFDSVYSGSCAICAGTGQLASVYHR